MLGPNTHLVLRLDGSILTGQSVWVGVSVVEYKAEEYDALILQDAPLRRLRSLLALVIRRLNVNLLMDSGLLVNGLPVQLLVEVNKFVEFYASVVLEDI